MSKYLVVLNQDKCIGCRACEIICKVKNKGALGKLFQTRHVKIGNRVNIVHFFMPCFHCEQPWCVEACPAEAMVRRDEDGIVVINNDNCHGCVACVTACPWGVPQVNESNGAVVKCDLCIDLIKQGIEPACVTGCPTKALSFKVANEDSELRRAEYSKKTILNQLKQRKKSKDKKAKEK